MAHALLSLVGNGSKGGRHRLRFANCTCCKFSQHWGSQSLWTGGARMCVVLEEGLRVSPPGSCRLHTDRICFYHPYPHLQDDASFRGIEKSWSTALVRCNHTVDSKTPTHLQLPCEFSELYHFKGLLAQPSSETPYYPCTGKYKLLILSKCTCFCRPLWLTKNTESNRPGISIRVSMWVVLQHLGAWWTRLFYWTNWCQVQNHQMDLHEMYTTNLMAFHAPPPPAGTQRH